jgi:hypothetical protein
VLHTNGDIKLERLMKELEAIQELSFAAYV